MWRTEGHAPGPDELAIIGLVNRWMVYRDSGDWIRLRQIWHEDGTMAASWRQGTADDFIAANIAGWGGKFSVFHELSAIEAEVRGNRGISQNKMTITQRGPVDGVMCDVTCMARHLDRWEKRDGLWGLLTRQTIFDRDRIDPVVPGQVPKLEAALLNAYPEPCRHLAYLQTKLGYEVKQNQPCLRTPEGDALLSDWRGWLEGNVSSWHLDADKGPSTPSV